MLRKIVITITALIVLFSLVGLTACKNNNDEAKKIYSLQEAYANGLLNKEDVKHIGFFVSGGIYEIQNTNNERVKLDFTPQFEMPVLSIINDNTIAKIKSAFYEKNKQRLDTELSWLKNNGYLAQNISAIDTISVVSFLGEYNGALAVQIETSLILYGPGSFEVIVDNIVWWQLGLGVEIYK